MWLTSARNGARFASPKYCAASDSNVSPFAVAISRVTGTLIRSPGYTLYGALSLFSSVMNATVRA